MGARIEVYWTGMRAWYPGRVLPLQEEDEEGSMRVAYDDGEELLHPLSTFRASPALEDIGRPAEGNSSCFSPARGEKVFFGLLSTS